MILTPLQKMTKNGEDWGKLIVAKAFKKLPKVQNIAQSGHTDEDIWYLLTVPQPTTTNAGNQNVLYTFTQRPLLFEKCESRNVLHDSKLEISDHSARIRLTTRWAVVVAQLAELSLPIPEDPGLNPVIGNFY